jgi:hypothetical protein
MPWSENACSRLTLFLNGVEGDASKRGFVSSEQTMMIAAIYKVSGSVCWMVVGSSRCGCIARPLQSERSLEVSEDKVCSTASGSAKNVISAVPAKRRPKSGEMASHESSLLSQPAEDKHSSEPSSIGSCNSPKLDLPRHSTVLTISSRCHGGDWFWEKHFHLQMYWPGYLHRTQLSFL